MGIMSKVVLAAIFTFMAMLECSGVQLKIISFNIQHFARRDKFYRNYNYNYRSQQVSPLAQSLVQILKEYDIIFIQEIKGATNSEAVTDLVDILNEPPAKRRRKERDSDHRYYEVVWPECFFDTTGNAETYAYYINTEKIKNWDANLYPSRTFDQGRSRRGSICRDYMGPGRNGNSGKYFVRPPYSLCVKDNADRCLFFLLGLHAKPLAKPDARRQHLQTTKQELDNFKTAYRYFENYYGTGNAILMGDLNADGPYLTYAQFRYLGLTRSVPGKWISYPIGKQHTNVNGDSMVHPATYDRFFGTANMLECLKEAEVVDEPIITKISDHYPIAITIDCAKFDLDGSGGAA